MSDPQTGRRSRSNGLCRIRAGPASPAAPENSKANFLPARELGAREVPHRNFSALARLGRSALQDVFGRCRGRERGGHGVSRDAARSFAGNGAATFARGPARRGSERRVPLPRSGNVRAVVQIAGAAERILAEAVYGLPELYADQLPDARLVANPGCYPTSVILGLRPLVESGWIAPERGIVCDCKSGATGAGKEPKKELHFAEVDENFRAYGLFSHRHTPEVTDHMGIADEDMSSRRTCCPWRAGFFPRCTCGSPSRIRRRKWNRSTGSFMRTAR